MSNISHLTPSIIGYYHTNLEGKFGLPRQSGIAPHLLGKIIFLPKYRDPSAFRGLEGFSHIWLLWLFSESEREGEPTLTVRPPKLGGNTRMGVFATRSPYRPTPIGLSSVKIERIDTQDENEGVVLYVSGADLADGTPIIDIKPYLPFCDVHSEATAGFTQTPPPRLHVDCPTHLLASFAQNDREAIIELLAEDPRPGYHSDPNRTYAITYAGYDIHFRVEKDTLSVVEITAISS